MSTVIRRVPDVYLSVYKYLRETTYTIASTTASLEGHHEGLKIIPAFPDDLMTLKTPTVGLVVEDETPEGALFGQTRLEDVFHFAAYGFVLNQGTDRKNREYRDMLRNDLYELLRLAEDEGLTLLDHESTDDIGNLEVIRVASRLLPGTIPDIEADRYRFLVEFDVAYA